MINNEKEKEIIRILEDLIKEIKGDSVITENWVITSNTGMMDNFKYPYYVKVPDGSMLYNIEVKLRHLKGESKMKVICPKCKNGYVKDETSNEKYCESCRGIVMEMPNGREYILSEKLWVEHRISDLIEILARYKNKGGTWSNLQLLKDMADHSIELNQRIHDYIHLKFFDENHQGELKTAKEKVLAVFDDKDFIDVLGDKCFDSSESLDDIIYFIKRCIEDQF